LESLRPPSSRTIPAPSHDTNDRWNSRSIKRSVCSPPPPFEMPPRPRDTSRPGCMHVGGDREISRESDDWIDPQPAYCQQTMICCWTKRITLNFSRVSTPVMSSIVNPHYAFRDPCENLPCNCSRPGSQFTG